MDASHGTMPLVVSLRGKDSGSHQKDATTRLYVQDQKLLFCPRVHDPFLDVQILFEMVVYGFRRRAAQDEKEGGASDVLGERVRVDDRPCTNSRDAAVDVRKILHRGDVFGVTHADALRIDVDSGAYVREEDDGLFVSHALKQNVQAEIRLPCGGDNVKTRAADNLEHAPMPGCPERMTPGI